MYSRRGFGVVSWKVVLSKQAAKDGDCILFNDHRQHISTWVLFFQPL